MNYYRFLLQFDANSNAAFALAWLIFLIFFFTALLFLRLNDFIITKEFIFWTIFAHVLAWVHYKKEVPPINEQGVVATNFAYINWIVFYLSEYPYYSFHYLVKIFSKIKKADWGLNLSRYVDYNENVYKF